MPLTSVAREAEVPLSTAKRWVHRYRAQGLEGLARRPRSDKGTPRILLTPVQELIEGLALQKPRRSIAGIWRIVADAAKERGWAMPSYAAVRAVVNGLDPALLVLAHEGSKAYADGFELLHRREAASPTRSGRPITPCSTSW